ncbi:MAG TPA: MBL fold metallo-hydrolase [bacterium]|nr:MBL fold metallo-hydrolase [bacterium]
MQIQWLGNSCFKFLTKNNSHETVIITDPPSAQCGLGKNRLAADIIVLSQEKHELLDNNPGAIKGTEQTAQPFIIKSPGEYELRNCFFYGLPRTATQKNTVFVFSIEDIKIGFLGLLNKKELSAEELESIEGVDILLIPVGGQPAISSADAATLANQIEPRIIIPMFYKIPGLTLNLDNPDKFIKEMGNHKEELDKLKIVRKDLPQEDTRLILLKP